MGEPRVTATVDERGRLVIPGHLRQSLDMQPGDAVVLTTHGDELRIVSARRQRATIARRLRGAVTEGDTVDDLLAARRVEPASRSRSTPGWRC